jgi:hypothetical protein
MRFFQSLLVLIFIFSAVGVGISEEHFPIISANGFTCSKEEGMVTCRGSFPESPNPVLEGTGHDVIWLRAQYPGKRYTYFSDSGCLCRTEFKEEGDVKQSVCTSRTGKEKIFKGKKDSFKWCNEN